MAKGPYNLKELRAATDEACAAAERESPRIEGAINWADLGCITAERYEDDEGNTGHRVLLAEAAPGEWRLSQYVAKHLEAAGFKGVEVVTEW